MDEKSTEPNKQGVPTRDILYAEAAKHAPRAIEVVVDLLDCANENVRLGAAKTILAKAIPDLKVVELSGADGGAIQLIYKIDMAGGYIPPLGVINATSNGSNPGQTPLQGTGVAQTSQEDNNSDNRDSQAGTV